MVHTIVWTDERVEHIAAHNVTPEEFEEVCFGHSLVLRTKSTEKKTVYHILGQTAGGVYLLCIVILFPGGRGFPVTARLMTPKEERRYKVWKR